MSSIGNLAKDLYTIMHNADEKGPKPYEPVATVVKNDEKNDDVLWVKLPGGNSETPVEKTMDAEPGDKVRLRVSGGRAWVIGNGTSPPASSEATIRYIQNGLEYNPAFAENFSNSIVQNSTVVNSAVENAIVKNSEIVESRIYNSNIENFTVINGVVQGLEATDAVIQGHLEAHDAEFESLATTYATIEELHADYATIDELHSDYAEIDLANVNNAWIDHGTMKKAEVFDENVFDLSGDHATIRRIDASKINVANLRADNLIVRRINGQPVVGGYTLIDSTSSGYASKNPQTLGWYEFVNAQWVLSTDTTVDMTKAYYQTGNEVSLYDQAYIDGLENDLQQQIDGAVETFTGSVVPTLVNWPYTDWYDTSVTPVHDERAKHVGDIYYVVNSASDENGYCYRFAYDNTQHAYDWVLIKDSDVTKALSDISDLQIFESTTTSWIDETDEGLETIRTNHTALAGVVDKTVKESVQLWFTKANTTAPNKPTAEVTSTSTAGNAWRKVVPAYNASYPNYYYCWQYKFVDDTFGWSDVVRDIAMGETQGVARDAKNTADAALPASTFETFESTTFTDLVDEVDEQSTTMTNMTTRLGLNADGTATETDIVAKESALEQTVDGISTRVGRTETKLKGTYAVSTTAAGTATKVATITPTLADSTQWVLTSGTIITVKFEQANTTTSPKLNVNSKGAYPIVQYNGNALTTTAAQWKAGSTMTFVFDNGSTKRWLLQDATMLARVKNAETNITQTADSIVSLASNNETYTKPDGTTATNAIKSSITQTANSIESVVANNDTYTAPDGTTKTNTIKSAITQNANDISLRVEKSGVIAAINASVEEEGGSAVKINANKVNITGTTIFNAVDADANTKAAMLNSELEIGGRNLLIENNHTALNCTYSSHTITNTQADGKSGFQLYIQAFNDSTYAGAVYRGSMSSTTGTRVLTFDSGIAVSAGWKLFVKHNGSTKDIGVYYYVNTDIAQGEQLTISFDVVSSNPSTVGGLVIKDIKLERGNKSTDWTPAPEDVQAEIDAKKSVHTLGTSYSYTYANILTYSAEGYSGTWNVTSSAGVRVGDTVRLKVTVSDMSNTPVYVIGTVTAINSATQLVMASHGLDTTIIDGGNILTNSIGANQIAANSIGAKHLTISDSTNLATVNEMYESSLPTNITDTYQPVISGGYLVKKTATQPYLMVTDYTSNSFTQNNELYYEFYGKAAVAGEVMLSVWGYSGTPPTHTYLVRDAVAINLTTSEAKYSGTLTLTNANWDTATQYLMGFGDERSTKSQIYIRKMVVRRKNGGELIVDGSITANKIKAGAITIGKMDSDAQNGVVYTVGCSQPISGDGTLYPYLKLCTITAVGTYVNKDLTFSISSRSSRMDTAVNWAFNNSGTATSTIVSHAYKTGGVPLYYVSEGNGIYGIYLTKAERYENIKVHSLFNPYPSGITITWVGTEVTALPSGYVAFTELAGSRTSASIDNAAKTATTYITKIDDYGIFVSPSNQNPTTSATGNSVKINSDGMYIYQGGAERAYFKASAAAIGTNGGNRSVMDSTGLHVYQLINGTQTDVAQFGDTARIGKQNNGRVEISDSEVEIYSSNALSARIAQSSSVGGSLTIYGTGGLSSSDQSVLIPGALSLSSTSNGMLRYDSTDKAFATNCPLYVLNHSEPIGYVQSSYLSSSKTISANTVASLCYVTLAAGTWVITAVVQFPNGSDTTYRRLKIMAGSNTSAEPPDVQVNSINGYPTTLNATIVVNPTKATTYYLNVMSYKALTLNAGSVGGYNYIRAVCIA